MFSQSMAGCAVDDLLMRIEVMGLNEYERYTEDEADDYEEYEEYSSSESMDTDDYPLVHAPVYMNQTLEEKVAFLRHHLNNPSERFGVWESNSGIIVNYHNFVHDEMLRKLVEYWNEEIENAVERGILADVCLGIRFDHFSAKGVRIYAVWLCVTEQIDNGERCNTLVKKTWIGEGVLLQFLLVLAHAQVRNAYGEFIPGW